jgi:hypothetical protein
LSTKDVFRLILPIVQTTVVGYFRQMLLPPGTLDQSVPPVLQHVKVVLLSHVNFP